MNFINKTKRTILFIAALHMFFPFAVYAAADSIPIPKLMGMASARAVIPVPAHKPNSNTSIGNQENTDLGSDERALISFAMRPDQIDLDAALEQFLKDHAINMFRTHPDLRMEIHAYATTEDNQAGSDVRRSLARALEVRSFLLKQDIEPWRLKLTAMGQDEQNKADNRIDLLFVATK